MKLITRLTTAITRAAADAFLVGAAPKPAAPCAAAEALAEASEPRIPAPLTDVKGDVPAVSEIEQAARDYETARERTNAAARLKRKAEKILKRTPDGQYGSVTVERYESSRKTADLDAIRRIFAEHNLGDVPMKTCSPSLAITFAAEAADAEPMLAAA